MHNSQTMPASRKETGFRDYIHPLIQRKLTIRHSKSKKWTRLLYKHSHIVHPVFRNPVTISAFWMTFHKRAYTFLHSIRKLTLQAKLQCLKDIYSRMFKDRSNNPNKITYHIDHSGKLPSAQLQTSVYQELWKLSCMKVTLSYLEENNKLEEKLKRREHQWKQAKVANTNRYQKFSSFMALLSRKSSNHWYIINIAIYSKRSDSKKLLLITQL